MEHSQVSGGFTELLIILFKQKNKILFVFFTIVISVTVASFLMKPVYESRAKLLVKFGREYLFQNEVGDARAPSYFSKEDVMNTEVHILSSEDLAEKVIRKVGLEVLYPELLKKKKEDSEVRVMKKALDLFKKSLGVSYIRKSDVISIGFDHSDPEIAAFVVNTVVDLFTERHLQIYSNPQTAFLRKQLSVYQERMEKSENDLKLFKKNNKVFSIQEQRTLMLRQYDSLDMGYKNARNRIEELKQVVASLNKQLETTPENVVVYNDTQKNFYVDSAMSKLLGLQLQEQDLLTKYDANNRLVVSTRKEIQLVKDFIAENESKQRENIRIGKNNVYQNILDKRVGALAELSSLEAKSSTIAAQLAKLEKEIEGFDAKETMLNTLKRELEENEKNFKDFSGKYEEARLSAEMDREKLANVSVIQEALVSEKPVKPNKRSNVLMSIILGAASAISVALFFEYVIEQSMSTPENVERRLGIPVIATISYKG